MANKDSISQTLFVATVLCIVCSVLVSSAAIALRARQDENKVFDKQRNVLMAAGLYDPSQSSRAAVAERFARFQPEVVDLATGQVASGIDPATFDARVAGKDPALSVKIPPDKDKASLKQRSAYETVYRLLDGGKLDLIVLPISGKGLWGTMYGFLALDSDLVTSRGLVFYEHVETPGLGGEVDNANWKALWPGKKLLDASGEPIIEVIKGQVDPSKPGAEHQVDGLSGATITTRGVDQLMEYWLGEHGYGPYLARLRSEGPTTTSSPDSR